MNDLFDIELPSNYKYFIDPYTTVITFEVDIFGFGFPTEYTTGL